ncbi:MAG: YebC/PmpR family DNA-binding transcriptional regulator [Endomicrobiales bacterium]|nr:YebC/PmpR family DNA-binding transcriptional regulator [Endomicrobiales bacterium]
MSGHSRWAGIKHKKAAADAKRGKVFTKIIREIVVAAREGGGIIENNPRLRKAIEMGREANMPQDNIKKAIQRGTGEIPGAMFEEIVYEGYGPGGVAVMVEGTTDNKNRFSAEVRNIFSKHGGNMGENGCVAWMFSRKGYMAVEKSKAGEEELMTLVLELGADDLKTDDEDVFEIITKPEEYEKVKQGLEAKKIPLTTAELSLEPQTYIKLEGKQAQQMIELMDELEAQDDVKNVYANFDISKEEIEAIEANSN